VSWQNHEKKRVFFQALITRTGANAGDCALFNVDEDALASSHTFIIRSGTWPHHFLAAFLNSYYGRSQIMKGRYGAAQPEVAPNYLRSIWIPRFSSDFYAAIGRIFASAKERRDVAFTQLESAEQTLLRALGLSNWQPPEPLTYIRSSRDAFTTERLDAEYFYPAKQAALDLLATMPGKTVGEMFGSVRDLWQPENANQAELVRNYDLTDALSPFLDITKESTTPETISSTKKRIAKGDIVVSRLRSYLKEIAVVLDGDNISMVGSTEFIVLRPKKQSVRIETLLVYLRSTLPQLIFKWSQDGSNHPRFNEKELLNLRVPDIIIEYEDEIAEKVQSAIRSRRRAAELLEAAKRAVEIAIEDSEEAALAYLKSVKDA
jgi:type I restriction enzyme S subunit